MTSTREGKMYAENTIVFFYTPILALSENSIDTCILLYPVHLTLQDHWNQYITSIFCSSEVNYASQGLKLFAALDFILQWKQ